MKTIKFLLFTALLSGSLSAEVRLDVRFPGLGNEFNYPENAWMKEAVLDAASDLGKFIKQDAVVRIDVYSKVHPAFKAEAQPNMWQSFGKVIWPAMDKVINKNFVGFWAGFCDFFTVGTFAGEIGVCSSSEGLITFNTKKFSDFKTLKLVASHELTHVLGFASFVGDIKKIAYGRPYGEFDELIADKDGNRLFIDGRPNRKFVDRSELFICGENIRKRNDGKCIRLFNPSSFLPGSSVSHFDTETYPKNLMAHRFGDDHYPTWNKYEIGVMEELGYEIDWKNYCQIVERDVFKTHRLSVHMSGTSSNSYFVLRKLMAQDFPQECFLEGSGDEIFRESFSVPFADGYELQYYVGGELVHTTTSIKEIENLKELFGHGVRLDSAT